MAVRRAALAILLAILLIPVFAAPVYAASHTRHGGHGGRRSRGVVVVNGVVSSIIDERTFSVSAGGVNYTVVLPSYLTAPNGTKVPASLVVSALSPGASVTVEGYLHERPCYGDMLLRASSITIDGVTYTWSGG